MPKIKVIGETVQTGECPRTHTDKRADTHTDATKRYLPAVDK